MSLEEVIQHIVDNFSEVELLNGQNHCLKIPANKLLPICEKLQQTEGLYFDQLACITGLHNEKDKTLEVVYNLNSIPYGNEIELKVVINDDGTTVPSVSSLWKAADWFEREIFDLFGIQFENHPDLRRILLPANWEGFPLRKDYKTQEYYHGIKVDY